MLPKESYLRNHLIVQTLSQQLFAFLVLRALFVAWEAMWTWGVLTGGSVVMEK